VEDGYLDAVRESVQGDIEAPSASGSCERVLTAHLFRGFRKPVASCLVETRLVRLKMHGAADGSGQAQVPVQMKLNAARLSGHMPGDMNIARFRAIRTVVLAVYTETDALEALTEQQ